MEIFVIADIKRIPEGTAKIPVAFIKQNPVDDLLEKQDGTIKRERDQNFCKRK